MVDFLKGSGGGPDDTTSGSDSKKANSFYRGVYVISQGPLESVGTATDLGKRIYLNDVPILDEDGDSNFDGIEYEIKYGTLDQTHLAGQDSVSTTVIVGGDIEEGNPVSTTVAGEYDAITVTVGHPDGLYRIQDDGDYKGYNVSYVVEYQVSGSSSWITAHSVTRKEKIITAFDETHRIELQPGTGPWEVRVRRTSDDPPNPNYIGKITFKSYGTIVDGKFSYPGIAHLGIQVNSREFGNSIPKVSFKGKGIKVNVPKNYDPVTRAYATSGIGTTGGIWDGTFKSAYTTNPVWIYYDILINNRYGLGQYINADDDLALALADKWNLYTIGQYCDGMVADGYGGTEPRFSFNQYIADEQSAFDFVRLMASTFRGMVYWASNQVITTADIPGSPEVLFNQTDVEDGLFTYSGSALSTRSTAVIVSYANARNLYKQEVEVVEDYSLAYELGYREKTIRGFGVTSRGLARRLGKWLLLTEKFQTQVVQFSTGFKGSTLFPGMIILVADPYKSGARTGGRILETTSTTLTLDAPVILTGGVTYTVKYTLPDGTTASSTVLNSAGTTSTLTVASMVTQPIAGGVWVMSSNELAPKRFRVLTVKQEENKFIVTALEDYADKYSLIEEGPDFEDQPTAIVPTTQIPAPLSLTYQEWYTESNGSEVQPHLTVSWTPPDDVRVNKFELQIQTALKPWYTVYKGADLTWDSSPLEISDTGDYQLRIRSVSILGVYSPWLYSDAFDIIGKDAAPPQPTNVSTTDIIKGIIVSWDNATVSDFKHTEIWGADVNNLASAILLGRISDDFLVINDLTPGSVVYFWLRTVTHATTNNLSTYTDVVSGEALAVNGSDIEPGTISITELADTISPPEIVASLPAVGNYEGRLVFLTTDGKLYRYHSGAWTSAVPAVDVTGAIQATQLANGIIDNTKIAGGLRAPGLGAALPTLPDTLWPIGSTYVLTTDGKLYRNLANAWTAAVPTGDLSGTISGAQIAAAALDNTKFASGLRAPGLGSALPTLPHASWPAGTLFTLTTDGKLYRSQGSTWSAAVPTTDLSGTIINAQIAAAAIDNTKFASGIQAPGLGGTLPTLPSASWPSGSLYTLTTDGKLYRSLGSSWTAAVPTSDLSGTITTTQIGPNAVTTAKLAANAVTANEIAAGTITATQIAANTITAAKIVSGTITATELAAGAVTTAKLAANAVTANEILAGSITTAKLAAGAVTANEIAANTITAAKIQAGAITATEIAAGAITAGKLAIGDFDNLIPNGNSEDTSFTSGYGANNVSTAAAYQGTRSRQLIGTSINVYVTGAIPCTADDEFYFEAMACSSGGGATHVYMNITLADGSAINAGALWGNYTDYFSNTGVSTGSWTKIYVSAKMPATAVSVSFALYGSHATVSQNYYFDNLFAHRKNSGRLIVDGAISANKISAGAVTASKLQVGGGGTVLNSDPNFTDSNAWTLLGGLGGGEFITVIDGKVGTTAVRTQTGVITLLMDNLRIPVDPSKTYRFSVWVSRNTAANGTVYAGPSLFDSTGTAIAGMGSYWLYTPAGATPTADTWTYYEVMFGAGTTNTIPSNARTMSAFVWGNYGGSAGYYRFQGVKIEQASDATLIADGAITTNKITANAITTAKIAAGAITATEIGASAVTASKILAGSIASGHIAANTIVAGNIAAGTITANEIAANTITAGKIAAAAIGTTELAAGAVTATQIAANTITAAKIAAGTITAIEIGDAQITTAKFANLSVTTGKINNLAVDTLQIAGNAVTVPVSFSASPNQVGTGVGNLHLIATCTVVASDSGTLHVDFVAEQNNGSAGTYSYYIYVNSVLKYTATNDRTQDFVPIRYSQSVTAASYVVDIKWACNAAYTMKKINGLADVRKK